MSNVKPCPFCGVSLEHVPPSKVFYHENNGCILSSRNFMIDDIEKWNERKLMERIISRIEEELKWTRAEQSIECERRNGYGSPLQSKNSGKIEALKKTIEICKEEGGTSD